MRRVCYICTKQYGVKQPFDNDDETSGMCPACYPIELERLEQWLKEHDAKVEKENSR